MEESYKELWDTIAEALLQLEEPTNAIIKYYGKTQKCSQKQASEIYKTVVQNKEFQEYLKTYVEIQSESLIDENNDTIRLKLNKIYSRALKEGKYNEATKILSNIGNMLNIQQEQMEFKIDIGWAVPEDTDFSKINFNMLKEADK
ncbi:MAG: hypothetical protein J6Y02_19505 [Pseudobutyrivibrio sp.]|nr:hypothetical protein [Pseudobutyrivibrio sp.]